MEGQQRAENARKGLAIRQNLWEGGVGLTQKLG